MSEQRLTIIGTATWGDGPPRGVPPRQPTGDECTSHSHVAEFDAYAVWYPQQGGYVGKCWIQFDDNDTMTVNGEPVGEPGGCFTAHVYHDGEFPMHDDNAVPISTHHCMWEQFVQFGEAVRDFEIARRDRYLKRAIPVKPKELNP